MTGEDDSQRAQALPAGGDDGRGGVEADVREAGDRLVRQEPATDDPQQVWHTAAATIIIKSTGQGLPCACKEQEHHRPEKGFYMSASILCNQTRQGPSMWVLDNQNLPTLLGQELGSLHLGLNWKRRFAWDPAGCPPQRRRPAGRGRTANRQRRTWWGCRRSRCRTPPAAARCAGRNP